MSDAEVFRKRQSIGDLKALIAHTPDATFDRLFASHDAFAEEIIRNLGPTFTSVEVFDVQSFSPRHYEEILLAAALPEEDFQCFILASAIVIATGLGRKSKDDMLYWKYDAFHAHYRLAEARERAAIHNGLRTIEQSGLSSFSPSLEPEHCLTRLKSDVLTALSGTGQEQLETAIITECSAEVAGTLWDKASSTSVSEAALHGFRYLAERPVGLAPPEPLNAALISWNH
ncbi:MAG: hypothetical protein OXQ30_10075 [Boseongicola sp.]|nr:hypothetical protein [Boseongicola sp.]